VAGLWLLLPTVSVQLGVALTDLLTVAFFLTALLFGYIGWVEKQEWMLGVSTLSFALLLGTKQTALFSLPVFALFVIAALVVSQNQIKRWFLWVGMSLLVVVFLGLDRYLLNWKNFGHPLGDPESFGLFTGGVEITVVERIGKVIENGARTLVNVLFADLDFLPSRWIVPLWDRFMDIEPLLGSVSSVRQGVPWLGFMGALTVIYGAGAAVYFVVRKRSWLVGFLVLPAIFQIGTLYLIRPSFSLAFSRYILSAVALVLPVTAVSISAFRRPERWLGRIGAGCLALLVVAGSLVQSAHSLTDSYVRPLGLVEGSWGESQMDVLLRSTGFSNRLELKASLDYLDSCVDPSLAVGIAFEGKYPQGLLFGEGLHREVRQLPGVDFLTPELFNSKTGLGALVIATEAGRQAELNVEVFSREDADLVVAVFGPVSVVGPSSGAGCGEGDSSLLAPENQEYSLLAQAADFGFFQEVEKGSLIVAPENGSFVAFLWGLEQVPYFARMGLTVVSVWPEELVSCEVDRLCTLDGGMVYLLRDIKREEGTSFFLVPAARDLGHQENPLVSMNAALMFGPGSATPYCQMEEENAGKVSVEETMLVIRRCSGGPALLSTFLKWLREGCSKALQDWYICQE
jgi:hypothetical protein